MGYEWVNVVGWVVGVSERAKWFVNAVSFINEMLLRTTTRFRTFRKRFLTLPA